ncbi:adenosylcobinamide-GDP ribazoletransferase, partial [Palleronia sediminis]
MSWRHGDLCRGRGRRRVIRTRLAEAQVALMLLTRLPAGRIAGAAPGMGASAWAWPLAGLVVGLIAAAAHGVAWAAGCDPLIAGLLAVAAAVLATGALHEDGLGDVADGFGGGRDRDAKLAIMRDSRVGSYGVIALILALGLKAAALAQLGAEAAGPLVAAAMASRAVMPVLLVALPPARGDGLGRGAAAVGRGRAAL